MQKPTPARTDRPGNVMAIAHAACASVMAIGVPATSGLEVANVIQPRRSAVAP